MQPQPGLQGLNVSMSIFAFIAEGALSTEYSSASGPLWVARQW